MSRKRRFVSLAAHVILAAGAAYGAARIGANPSIIVAVATFFALRALAAGAPLVRDTTAWLVVEGHARALAWTSAGFAGGMTCAQLGQPGFIVSLTFAGVAVSGASLQGHHAVLKPRSRAACLEEGLLGNFVALVGWVGFASIVHLLQNAWLFPAMGVALVLGLPFALKATLDLLRSHDETLERKTKAGWFVWYEDSFFLHTILLALVVMWLVARSALRAALPRPTLVEYALGAIVVASFAFTIRRHLRKRLVEEPVRSPHQMHQARIEKVGLARFDALDDALEAFVARADVALARQFSDELRPEQAHAREALRDVVAHEARPLPILVPAAWSYGGLVVAALAIALVAPATSLLLAGAILFVGGFARYGGPAWAGPTASLAGVATLAGGAVAMGASAQAALVGAGVGIVVVALVAFLRYRKPARPPGLARTRAYGAEARAAIKGGPLRVAGWALAVALFLPLLPVLFAGVVDVAALVALAPEGVLIVIALCSPSAARMLGIRANIPRLDAREAEEVALRRALCDAALARLAARKPTKRASARPLVAVPE